MHMQESTSLANLILTEQMENNWPGLSYDAKVIAENLNITGLFDKGDSKMTFKRAVKCACMSEKDENLKLEIGLYKKMNSLRDEVVKGNGYIFTESLQNARSIFRIRAELFEAKINFKQMKLQSKEISVITKIQGFRKASH